MHPRFTHIIRLFAAGVAVACACAGSCMGTGAGGPGGGSPWERAPAKAPPAALARRPVQTQSGAGAAVDAAAPGFTQVLQAEFPERKLPGLQEILRQGLIDGPTILMSQWNAAAVAQDARLRGGGRADMLPQVNGYVQYGPTYEQHQGDGASNRTMTAFFYGLDISQPLYQWNTLTNNYQIRKLSQAIAERDITEQRRILAISIRRAYFNIILKTNELALARKTMERYERDHKETEQAIKDGTLAAGAIDGPNRAMQLQKPEIMRLENELAGLRRGMAQITGLPESAIDKTPTEIPPLPEAELHDAVYALSATAGLPPSANLQRLADAARQNKLAYENAKKILYPRFGIDLNVNEQSRTANYSNQGVRYVYTVWSALAVMNWTLFDGFNASAAKRAAMERLKAAEASRAQTERQEPDDRRAEAASLQVQWEQLLNVERDLSRTRGGMEIIGQDFKNGTASERDAENARASYENALQSAQTARAAFYIALVSCLSNRGQDPAIMAMQQ